jgi:predicted ATPase/DNA-binding SARP family transcriptional activator
MAAFSTSELFSLILFSPNFKLGFIKYSLTDERLPSVTGSVTKCISLIFCLIFSTMCSQKGGIRVSNLKLYLLGPPRLELDSAPVKLNRRKAVALLAYLAVTGESHSRDKLATLFWPEANQSRARANLRQTLWHLNNWLNNSWLDVAGETVALLSHTNFWVDVEAFRILLAGFQAHKHPVGELCTACVPLLTEAVTLYRQDFLTGFSLSDSPAFDEWQYFQTERLQFELADALQQLVRYHTAQEEFEVAILYTQRRLTLDPLHEPGQRELMMLYAWTGQRTAALRQYQTCVRVLEKELAASPEEETIQLYETIRNNQLHLPSEKASSARQKSVTTCLPARRSFNLPPQPTPFVGRGGELTEIAALLQDPACRLLTLVGPGGIGKTRLSIQAATQIAAHYPDDACFVSLAAITSVEFLTPAIADALRLPASHEGDPKSQLLVYLRERQLLLVIDNFDHLPNGADLMTDILNGAPGVKILVTSRERLHLQEEWIYQVQGLDYPQDEAADDLVNYDAVQLFLQSARRIRSNFTPTDEDNAAVIRICQLVEGMPLGVELAAAWLPIFSCREIAQEIEHSIDFLTVSLRNLPPRHRSMRAVFESSWERLSSQEKSILRKLSVFRGGFGQSAVQTVTNAAPPVLLALADKSLLRRNAAGRYEMHDLLRQFAEEKLKVIAQEYENTYYQHSAYYALFLRRREAALKSKGQFKALDEIEVEIDNIRVAWNWAITNRKVGLLQDFLISLALFYEMRSRFQQGQEMFSHAVEHLKVAPLSQDEQVVLAQLMVLRAVFCRHLVHSRDVKKLYQAAIPRLEPLDTEEAAFAFLKMGWLNSWQVGETEEAMVWLHRGLAICETNGDQWGIALALFILGDTAHYASIDYTAARRYYRQSLEMRQKIGDHWGEAATLNSLGTIAFNLGEYQKAEQLLREALVLSENMGDLNGIAWATGQLENIAIVQGRYEEARALTWQGYRLAREIGNQGMLAWRFYDLGKIALAQEQYEEASDFFQKSLETFNAINHKRGPARVLLYLSRMALVTGDADKAKQLAQESLTLSEVTTSPVEHSTALYHLGEATCELGDFSAAYEYLLESIKMAINLGVLGRTVCYLVGVARLLAKTGEPERAVELLAFVLYHPASWQKTKDRAGHLYAKLSAELPSTTVIAAEERGKRYQLEEVVAQIGELETDLYQEES